MRIIDSPGVVFDDDDFDDGKGNKKGSVLLRNVVKVEDIEDPIAVGKLMIDEFAAFRCVILLSFSGRNHWTNGSRNFAKDL